MRMQALFAGVAAAIVAGCGHSDSSGGSGSQGPAACGNQTLPKTFEAEDAKLDGVQVSSEGAGFSGKGYVAGFTAPGQQVTFTVCAPGSAYYTADFTYAKGTDGTATRTLLIDGKPYPGQPVFAPLWTWNTWKSGSRRSFHLDPGNHSIAVSFQQNDSGEIRLDQMTLSPGPSPAHTSVRSLFMNNWKDLTVAWHAAKLYPADDKGFGPRMTALHWAKDWPVNQIDEAQAFFRDETGNTAYTATNQFQTTAAFTASDAQGYGHLRVEYGDYGGKALPMSIVRQMTVPPGEEFVVVSYDIGNLTDAERRISILEWANLHNKNAPNEDIVPIPDSGGTDHNDGSGTASWDPTRNAWIADMSETNGTFVVMGSFDPTDHHVAGAPVVGSSDTGAATVQQFAAGASSLTDSGSFSGPNLGIGMSRTVALPGSGHAQISFYYGVSDSLEGARAVADHVQQGGPAGAWMDASSKQWKAWLGATPQTPVAQWGDALRIGLITNKQSQQPEFGSFVASTNPAYEYKVWVRDSSVTAMLFDATGHLDEAEKYWTWMAQAQQLDDSEPKVPAGSWWTNYSYFARNKSIRFVEPELDSVGLFLLGTYRHYQAVKARDTTRASRFLEGVWPVVQRAANFVQSEVKKPENFGFGAKDASIWEEAQQYAVFTQTTYVAGLHAAQLLAQERNDAASAQGWGAASSAIAQAIFRDSSIVPCPGAFNVAKRFFVRAVQPDCTLDERIDSSTDLLWVLGVLPADDPRALGHRRAVLDNLTPGAVRYGISRYQGDEFYHSTPFDPGHSHDALAAMPIWPQMSMYMAMLEHWLGMNDLATNRLSWYVATTNAGYQPAGEAVDWVTELPIVSSASEPVTAAWFGLALLNQLGTSDPRLP